jgi:hypothetical protein
MADQISHEHHYVPRWYQKRFLAPGEEKLWYLDLKPEKVTIDQQRSYTNRALCGPQKTGGPGAQDQRRP